MPTPPGVTVGSRNTSRLLNEHPLFIQPTIAATLGVNEALFLQNLQFWLHTNERSGRNLIDGHTWSYNSEAQWLDQFPFWSGSTLWRTINSLRDNNLVITEKLADSTSDHTLHYRINYEALSQVGLGAAPDRFNQALLEEATHEVSPTLASMLKVKRALLFQQLHYLIRHQEKNLGVNDDGFVWLHLTYAEIQKHAPYFEDSEAIGKAIRYLSRNGLVVLRRKPGSRTSLNLLRIDYEALALRLQKTSKTAGSPSSTKTSTDCQNDKIETAKMTRSELCGRADSKAVSGSEAPETTSGTSLSTDCQNDKIETAKMTRSRLPKRLDPDCQNDKIYKETKILKDSHRVSKQAELPAANKNQDGTLTFLENKGKAKPKARSEGNGLTRPSKNGRVSIHKQITSTFNQLLPTLYADQPRRREWLTLPEEKLWEAFTTAQGKVGQPETNGNFFLTLLKHELDAAIGLPAPKRDTTTGEPDPEKQLRGEQARHAAKKANEAADELWADLYGQGLSDQEMSDRYVKKRQDVFEATLAELRRNDGSTP